LSSVTKQLEDTTTHISFNLQAERDAKFIDSWVYCNLVWVGCHNSSDEAWNIQLQHQQVIFQA